MRQSSTRSADLFPEEVMSAFRRRLEELRGLALIGVAALAVAALATWSAQDPNFNFAIDGKVKNLLGRPGAAFADFTMQVFGLASLAIVLPLAVWGWLMLTHRAAPRWKLRIAFWLGGILLACGFFACFKSPASWPLPNGLGGSIGETLLAIPALVIGSSANASRILLGLVFGMPMVFTLAVAMGAGFRDEPSVAADEDESEEDDADAASPRMGFFGRISAFFGAITHMVYALRTRLAGRRPPRVKRSWRERLAALFSGDPEITPSRKRQEPTLVPGRGADARDDNEEEYEEDEYEDEEDEPRRARGPSTIKKSAPRRRGSHKLPGFDLLTAHTGSRAPALSDKALEENSRGLEAVLEDFGVEGKVVNARPGPVVTLYELEPAPGIKSSRVIGLADDIARSMSAVSARVAVIPGKNAIGIELPNPKREKVFLREQLESRDFRDTPAKLPICLGKTIGGEPVIVDLARMPHLLIAGTTGSGKSVAINTMILSLLYRLRPEECRLIMVDPKMLELSVYDGIPHLLSPVVTDPRKAVIALKWAVREMEDRYKKMSKLGVRSIDGFNESVADAAAKGKTIKRTVQTGFDRETGEAIYETEEMSLEPLPYIVVVVDEMADLMMVAGKDIEGAIQRLAQMARAAGIHLLMATQRPSVDVITGTIKANFPTRISFQVSSKIDSRTILNEQGAEQLLGQGDMLYMAGGSRVSRVHGPFVSDAEVERVVRHLKEQGVPEYLEEITAEPEGEDGGAVFDKSSMGEEGGDLYERAVAIVLRDKKASTSYVQRRLQIGYNRAATLIERMEMEGVISAPNHAGKREILAGGGE
ncbi:MAG: DNA translocase FtsK 4TM domain-containing protein [Xanthobacteraceae bacterium]|nr:DNA translocase FtsK 4TM domain-containing protein [Xanthobacteraceae bacterium]QYK44971.1 MAG: DNA translocase FtsK 4TM domain-containing protein [Xanthobacteraceae bacterium]